MSWPKNLPGGLKAGRLREEAIAPLQRNARWIAFILTSQLHRFDNIVLSLIGSDRLMAAVHGTGSIMAMVPASQDEAAGNSLAATQ